MTDEETRELEVLRMLIEGLSSVDAEARVRMFRTVATYFEIGDLAREQLYGSGLRSDSVPLQPTPPSQFSGHIDISPKEFIFSKSPRTDIERIACLAYYLTHYRETQEFGTTDVTALNVEAAQPRFANAAQAVKNATTRGFLVHASGGRKQLTAFGEQYVQALPDRVAVQAICDRVKPRKRRQSARPKAARR